MHLDLHHRPTLLKSWLASLHGPQVSLRPATVGPLPGWGALVRTAVAWHVAYALAGYAGALVIARSSSTSAVAATLREHGTPAVVGATLAIWWGAVAASTALWWVGVRQARGVSACR
ncbi:MAG: hypothetical protein JWO22_2015 [Frankiales bacterium]|nr:hypothetical protein [Frankiales bacterium]